MSQFFFKILVLPFLYLLSLLPFWTLYLLSDGLFLIIFYLVGYRKKVVIENLKKSLPEKNNLEINKITKQFYTHLCDVVFETIKLQTISISEFKKRCVYTNEAIKTFNFYFDKQQSIIGVMGHCGNWEWAAIAHQFYFSSRITGVYHPLSNKSFDAFMLKLRSRLGGQIIPMSQVYKQLLILKQNNIPTTLGLIADQTAPPESAYWTTFLNQDTPVFFGTEKIAKRFNYPVIFLSIKKIKRGYYELNTTVITNSPTELKDGEISELHTKHLEKDIIAQPFNWLWSHRRWKHKR